MWPQTQRRSRNTAPPSKCAVAGIEGLEGQNRDRHVVIEFDSFEQALECYHSPEYAAALEIRKTCAESDVIVVEGYDP